MAIVKEAGRKQGRIALPAMNATAKGESTKQKDQSSEISAHKESALIVMEPAKFHAKNAINAEVLVWLEVRKKLL